MKNILHLPSSAAYNREREGMCPCVFVHAMYTFRDAHIDHTHTHMHMHTHTLVK